MEKTKLEWLDKYLDKNNYKLVVRGTYKRMNELYYNEDGHSLMFLPLYGLLERFISVEFKERSFVFRNHRLPDGYPADEEEIPYRKTKYPKPKLAELFGKHELRVSQWIGRIEKEEKDRKIMELEENIRKNYPDLI
ncbi:MAG: hypothetical protein ACE5J7_00025 [Candidatus Aenigmatarchaeota archaeon]